jgi:hypothetical protein
MGDTGPRFERAKEVTAHTNAPGRDNNRYSAKQEANRKADHTAADQDYG